MGCVLTRSVLAAFHHHHPAPALDSSAHDLPPSCPMARSNFENKQKAKDRDKGKEPEKPFFTRRCLAYADTAASVSARGAPPLCQRRPDKDFLAARLRRRWALVVVRPGRTRLQCTDRESRPRIHTPTHRGRGPRAPEEARKNNEDHGLRHKDPQVSVCAYTLIATNLCLRQRGSC